MKVKLRLDLDTRAGRVAMRAYLDAVDGGVPADRAAGPPRTPREWRRRGGIFEPAQSATPPADLAQQGAASRAVAPEPLGDAAPCALAECSPASAGTGPAEAHPEPGQPALATPSGPEQDDAGAEAQDLAPATTLQRLGRPIAPATPSEPFGVRPADIEDADPGPVPIEDDEDPLPGANPDPDPAPPVEAEPAAPVDQVDVMGGGERYDDLDPERAWTDALKLQVWRMREVDGMRPADIARAVNLRAQRVHTFFSNVRNGSVKLPTEAGTALVPAAAGGALALVERRPQRDPQIVADWQEQCAEGERRHFVKQSLYPQP